MQDNDDLEAADTTGSGVQSAASSAPEKAMAISSVRIEPTNTGSAPDYAAASAQALYNPDVVYSSGIAPSELLSEISYQVRKVIGLVGLFYTALVILVSVLAVSLLAPDVFYFIDRHSPLLMDIARVLVSLVAIAAGVAALSVWLVHGRIRDDLELAEMRLDGIRDQTLIQLQAARFNLEELTERLKSPKESGGAPVSPLDYIELARQIGPLLSLLVAREKSILTLGVEGLKFFQTVKKVLNK